MSDSFVEVVGQRMALLGRESGSFELWQWPIKVAHDLRFEVTQEPANALQHGLEFAWQNADTEMCLRLALDYRPLWPTGLGC